jgi:alkylation response protein AidB-like acyl-CoA dehydrogenase
MDSLLTAKQRSIREDAREFADEEIAPVARQHHAEGTYPSAVIREAADRGFVAPHVSEKHGGSEFSMGEIVALIDGMTPGDVSISLAIGSAGVGTNLIQSFGDEWMRTEWHPKITANEVFSALAITEPDHGSDVSGMETTARRDGDEWVINGEKMWVMTGNRADVIVTLAKTDPGAGHQGISIFLVPTDLPGVEIETVENLMGLHPCDIARVRYDGVRMPANHLIGQQDRGFYHLMEHLPFTRTTCAARAMGAAQAALNATLEYVAEREQFDRPISEFQAVRHGVAEMATKVETIRALTYRAAAAVDNEHERIDRLTSMAKFHATELATEVADEAIQLHGANGYRFEHDVERYYRDVRVMRIYEGTNEIQKNIIANRLL